MNENAQMVRIIEVLLRIEGETPAAFKARIAAAEQIGASSEELSEGSIGRATITPDGLQDDMRWGQANDDLPADVCVVAWCPLGASEGKFVHVDRKVLERALRNAQIATEYAAEMRKMYGGGHTGLPTSIHNAFADAILSRNAYALEYLANGMNGAAKAAFTAATGISLPKLQRETWKVIRQWAGVSDAADAVVKAQHKVDVAVRFLGSQINNAKETQDWIRQRIKDGFTRLVNEPGRWVLANEAGTGYDLSKKGTGFTKARDLIKAELMLAEAQEALAAEQRVQTADSKTVTA